MGTMKKNLVIDNYSECDLGIIWAMHLHELEVEWLWFADTFSLKWQLQYRDNDCH